MTKGSAALRGAAVPFLIASVALLGCNTNADVVVDLAEDGSGTVSVDVVLDAEASAAIGGADGLALGDLEGTGWQVTGPEATEDSALRISATHDFAVRVFIVHIFV